MLKVKPDTRATQRTLERLQAQLGDLRVPMENASKELTRRVWYRFAFKRDPDGKRWQPWAASTKRNAATGRRLMLNTRKLRDETEFTATRKGVWIRFGASYGIHHEFGIPRKKLPRRAFIFSTRSKRALALTDEQYLLNAVRYQLRKAAKK